MAVGVGLVLSSWPGWVLLSSVPKNSHFVSLPLSLEFFRFESLQNFMIVCQISMIRVKIFSFVNDQIRVGGKPPYRYCGGFPFPKKYIKNGSGMAQKHESRDTLSSQNEASFAVTAFG